MINFFQRKDKDGLPLAIHPSIKKILKSHFWADYRRLVLCSSIGIVIPQIILHFVIQGYNFYNIVSNSSLASSLVHLLFLVIIVPMNRKFLVKQIEMSINHSIYYPDYTKIDDKYKIPSKDKKAFNFINPVLAKEKGLTDDEIKELVQCHVKIDEIKELMEKYDSPGYLKKYAKDVQEIEFRMQDLWKYKRDATYHKYWWTLPKCTCPKMDNKDSWGTKFSVHSSDCVIHGDEK